MTLKKKTAAIVVTYNRKDKLKECINCLLAQTYMLDRIFIIDNCSTDGTSEMLKKRAEEEKQITVLTTIENIGGAGGFAVGMAAAYNAKIEYLWLMDDDCVPSEDALGELFSAEDSLLSMGEDIGFLASSVYWKDGNICEMNQPNTAWDWFRHFRTTKNLVKVKSCSFVSVLFSRDLLDIVGLPLIDFFIWFDDVEFTRRISRIKNCYQVINSEVLHNLNDNLGVHFSRVDDSTVKKYSYGARNEGWYEFSRPGGILRWLYYSLKRVRQMQRGRVTFKNKILIIQSLLKSLIFKPKKYMPEEFNYDALLSK